MRFNLNKIAKISQLLGCFLVYSFVGGCSSLPQHKAQDVCSIFKHYDHWYWAAMETEKKWGIPIHVSMAIIYQESGFRSSAKPARKKLLGFIPWKRPTSAYGYSQAVNATWEEYQKKNKKSYVFRNNFSHAMDFLGWYSNMASKKLRIHKHDAKSLYLAYHEGIYGYKKGSYKKKKWLLKVANTVQFRANRYRTQLVKCRHHLRKKPWYRFI